MYLNKSGTLFLRLYPATNNALNLDCELLRNDPGFRGINYGKKRIGTNRLQFPAN